MKNNLITEIAKLNIDDRILLIETIWQSINDEPEILKAGGNHKVILEKRLEDFRKNPTNISKWETSKSRILSKI